MFPSPTPSPVLWHLPGFQSAKETSLKTKGCDYCPGKQLATSESPGGYLPKSIETWIPIQPAESDSRGGPQQLYVSHVPQVI